LLTFILSKRH